MPETAASKLHFEAYFNATLLMHTIKPLQVVSMMDTRSQVPLHKADLEEGTRAAQDNHQILPLERGNSPPSLSKL